MLNLLEAVSRELQDRACKGIIIKLLAGEEAPGVCLPDRQPQHNAKGGQ